VINGTKRDSFYGGERNLTRGEDMAINVLVHIADEGNDINSEEKLRSILDIKNTKLPLGSDVTVSRVSVSDFDECGSNDHNDCADNADCQNVDGSYTCACKDSYHDLSGPDSFPGRVCSGKIIIIIMSPNPSDSFKETIPFFCSYYDGMPLMQQEW
jgi:hypothetical protein